MESNLWFVPFIVRKYKGLGVPFEDLINEGNIGLIKAAKKFDPSKGAKFITYAVWWIHTSVKNALSRQQNVIRIPYRKTNQYFKIRQQEDYFYRNFQRKPGFHELANSLDISTDEMRVSLGFHKPFISLDQTKNSDTEDTFLNNLIEQKLGFLEKNLERKDLAKIIQNIVEKLSPRKKEIIEKRYGLNGYDSKKLHEIGEEMNLSRERIRQIEKDSLKELYKIAKRKEPDLCYFK